MKIPKINLQFLLIAILFILLVGISPMVLINLTSDIDDSASTTRLNDDDWVVYGYVPSQYVSSGVTAGEQTNILDGDLDTSGSLSPGQYFGITFDEEQYIGSFQYKVSNTFGQIETYDGSSWNFESTISGTGLELISINDNVQGVRFLAGGMSGTNLYSWGLQEQYSSSLNTMQTINLAPEQTFNRLNVNWTVYSGTASAEYSTDGSTWTAIEEDVEAELDSSSDLYLRFTLSGVYPNLLNINYGTRMHVPAPAPQSLTPTRTGKILIDNAMNQNSVNLQSSQSNIFPFIQNFFDFIKNLFGGLNT
jgi:hypothetical protein